VSPPPPPTSPRAQGKKAKRKARERMLEEAKRLASLQKLRELKAAGIDVAKRRKRKRDAGVDYSAEIPFEKRAPAGFHDTAADDAAYAAAKAAETADFKVTLLNKIEGESAGEREAKARAAEKGRLKRFAATNLPDVLAAEAEADPLNLRKRPKLALPAPSLSEGDLELLVKLGAAAGGDDGGGGDGSSLMLTDAPPGDDTGEGGSVVTAGLLAGGGGGGRGSTAGGGGGLAAALAALHSGGGGPGGASVVGGRTAMAARDALLEEARNHLRNNAAPTPLLGGENAPLAAGTGYGGVTPQTDRGRLGGAAPSVVGGGGSSGSVLLDATPSPAGGGRGGASVGRIVVGAGGLSSFLPAPRRDSLGINRADGGDGGDEFDSDLLGGGVSGQRPHTGAPAADDDADDTAADVASVAGTDADVGDSASVVMARGGGRRGGTVGSVLGRTMALSFAALPAPRHDYELLAPEDERDGDFGAAAGPAARRGSSAVVEDAGEAAARAAAAEAAAAADELRRRCTALQHDPPLPRPVVVDDDALAPAVGAAAIARGDARALADSLVRDEMVALLKGDAFKYPVRSGGGGGWQICVGTSLAWILRSPRLRAFHRLLITSTHPQIEHRAFRRPKRAPPSETPADDELDAARTAVSDEALQLRLDALEAGGGSDEAQLAPQGSDHAAWLAAWAAVRASHVYLPPAGLLVPAPAAPPSAVAAALRAEYERLAAAHAAEAARLAKAEARLAVTTRGFEMRADSLSKAAGDAAKAEADKRAELGCYARLAHDEAGTLGARLAAASAQLADEVDRQAGLQAAYAGARREGDDLRRALAMAGTMLEG
jgi:hypothetical protein